MNISKDNVEPLGYIHGMGYLVPGLEEELDNKVAGDKFSVTLPPEKAFGLYYENQIQITHGKLW